MAKFIYNHRVQDSISDITSKVSEISDSEIVLANVDEKIVFKNKSGNIVTVSSDAYNDIRIANFFDGAEYDDNSKQIVFKHGDVVKATIDATPFILDGMVDDVKIEDGKLKIIFNTESGKEEIDIELTDIFDPTNYYTKDETDDLLDKKVDKEIISDSNKALIFNEADGGGAKFEHRDGTHSFVGVNDGGANGIAAQIYAKDVSTNIGARLDISAGAMYYTVGSGTSAERMVAENEIAVKGEIPTDFYTQAEVDALLLAKETEIYNLTKIVGDMGGAVTYELPNAAGKSFNTLMGNNGTVKLMEDVTTGRYGPGITAKNKVTLNLNGKDLTFSGVPSTQAAIQSRGTQEITITGSTATTIDAVEGICIMANGASSVINLVGKTTYITNRPGAELIYCYAGTINISAGTFKNNGSPFLLNCYDANYRAGTANIIVTGGSFYDFNPADNSAEGEHTSFVPEGYHVETSTDGDSTVYTVKAN